MSIRNMNTWSISNFQIKLKRYSNLETDLWSNSNLEIFLCIDHLYVWRDHDHDNWESFKIEWNSTLKLICLCGMSNDLARKYMKMWS
jgi:hypothetical protein